MKKGIHPQYYPDAKVVCACGETWTTGSTKKEIRTDMCSKCHPFYTGEQRIVDTAGQVERFEKRMGQRREFESKVVARERKRAAKRAAEIVVEIPGEMPAGTAEAGAASNEPSASGETTGSAGAGA